MLLRSAEYVQTLMPFERDQVKLPKNSNNNVTHFHTDIVISVILLSGEEVGPGIVADCGVYAVDG